MGFYQTPSLGPAATIPSVKPFEVVNQGSLHDQTHTNLPAVFGKRMERYLENQIRQSDTFEVLQENLQIIDRGQTIGELDFILRDKLKQELVHLELAYKFYLYDPDEPAELPRWIGPNRNDRLVKKMEKLAAQQFPLLFRGESQQILEKLNLPELPWRQELCFKAQLYLPYQWQHALPPAINPKAVSGFWIHFKQFKDLQNAQFFLPAKENWTVDPALWTEWHNLADVTRQLENREKNHKATMCWIKHTGQTFEKCFVVWW